MNQLQASITAIQTSDNLALIELHCEGILLNTLIISNAEAYISEGNHVYLVFKETEVAIGIPPINNISIQNQFPCTIESIEKGPILAEIKLNFMGHSLKSIITTASCEMLNLNVKDKVIALVKTNEILLMKI
jgi:molybdopterin-binding protein